MQSFLKSAQSFKLFQTHMFNVLLTNYYFIFLEYVSHDWNIHFKHKTTPKSGVLTLKVLRYKTNLEVLFEKYGAYKSKYTLKPLLSHFA